VLKFSRTVPMTVERKGVVQFGEGGDWAPLGSPVDAVPFLDAPLILVDDAGGQRTVRSGRVYVRRGADVQRGDRITLPEGVFGITSGPELDRVHPMNGHDFGWMKFYIRTGG
jgi:hypothetical protein